MDRVRLVVLGKPVSMKNRRRIVKIGGKLRLIKSADAIAYEKAVKAQVKALHPMLEGELCVSVWMFYPSQRADLDPSLLFDALQGLLFKNDRQLREQHLYHGVDKENPRVEIEIERRTM